MSATPREIGTLIVVVLRANHLPNKRHIGKQDPYCAVSLNGEKRRTKAIKRGGQHPEWDEEIRFTIFEDNDDILARTARGEGTPPPPPPKDEKRARNIKGGKSMKLACYADDPREPDLIGECNVDLSEVLTKGETDDWFTLMNKDKFAGKVYLELTFWSNEPAPEKKQKRKVTKNNNQYAGPGSFVPAGDHSNSPSESHSRQASDVLPWHMRTPDHAANLYVAPYENNRNSYIDGLTQEFSDFGLSSQTRRRESFPPVVGAYSQTPYGSGHSTMTPYPGHGYDQGPPAQYSYEQPATTGQSTIHFPHSTSGPVQYSSYQPTFDAAPTYHPPSRGPRHSIATSSGFAPLHQASGFLPLSSHASEPSGFNPPVSHTPVPVGFPSQFNSPPQNVYSSPVSPTPAPSQHTSYLPQSTSLSFHPQQSHPASSSYNYSSYNIPASASAPPQQFMPSPSPQPNYPPLANTAPTQMYPSSPHELAHSPSVMYSNGNVSRPLPQQPQVVYTQPQLQQQPPIPPVQSLPELPPPPPPPPPPLDPRQSNAVYPANNGYVEIPPPPPPPAPVQYQTGSLDVSSMRNGLQLVVPPPPPPPPVSSMNNLPRARRTSLPVPPVSYQKPVHQQAQLSTAPLDIYSHVPPPPPPPPPQASFNTTPDRGLPKPPNPVNELGQWIQPANVYASQGY